MVYKREYVIAMCLTVYITRCLVAYARKNRQVYSESSAEQRAILIETNYIRPNNVNMMT